MANTPCNKSSRELSMPANVLAWYQSQLIRHNRIGWLIPKSAAGALYDPKIFDVLKPRAAYQFVAMDAWIRMMWRPGGLPRWMREAIAVAVSIANQCVY